MKCMLVVSCLVALAAATPGYLGAAPLAYSSVVGPAATFGYSPVSAYAASIALAPSVSLVDPVAIAAGAPLPVADTVEVAAARAAHFNAHAVAKAQLLGRKKRSPGYLGAAPLAYSSVVGPAATFGYSSVSAYAAPVAVAHAPLALAPSVSLVDPAAIAAGAPLPVADTVEVAAARAAHFNAHAVAKAQLLGRKKRSPGYLGAAPLAYSSVVGPATTFGYSSVSAHAAPFAVAHAPLALAPSVSIVDPVAIAAGAPLPVADTIEVAAARAAHFNAHAVAKTQLLGRKKRSPGFLNAAIAAPVTAYASPVLGYSSVLAHGPLAVAHGLY